MRISATILKTAPFFFFLLFVSTPISASAQNFPIPYWGPLLSCEGAGCASPCHIFKTGWNIVRFLLTLLVIIAVPVMIIVGGILVMIAGANEGLLALGKKILTGAIVGLLLGLGAYLIISTVVKLIGAKLNNVGSGGLAWPEVVCDFQGIEILPK